MQRLAGELVEAALNDLGVSQLHLLLGQRARALTQIRDLSLTMLSSPISCIVARVFGPRAREVCMSGRQFVAMQPHPPARRERIDTR